MYLGILDDVRDWALKVKKCLFLSTHLLKKNTVIVDIIKQNHWKIIRIVLYLIVVSNKTENKLWQCHFLQLDCLSNEWAQMRLD